MGRMGQTLVRLVTDAPDLCLHAAVEAPGHPSLGDDVGGVALGSDLASALRGTDVLVAFSSPAATALAARLCAEARVAAVLGTTGLDDAHRDAITQAARHAPIVFAPNMSTGVNVAYRLVAEARRCLGPAYQPAVFEAHHRWKKDSPSGTALHLAEFAGAPPESVVAVRGGDVIGDHTVLFLGDGERIEITHRATSRDAFAIGALRAARWVVGKPAGLYGMSNVLGIA